MATPNSRSILTLNEQTQQTREKQNEGGTYKNVNPKNQSPLMSCRPQLYNLVEVDRSMDKYVFVLDFPTKIANV